MLARQLRPHDHQTRGDGPNDGKQRILDIQPGKLHERVSVMLGSKNEVERLTSYHAK